MKRFVLTILVGSALVAAPALAQFEGEIDMKITANEGASGTGKIFVSKAGARSEFAMQARGTSMKMVSLMKFSNPDVMYLVNDAQRTYAEMNLKELKAQADRMQRGAKETWVVKKVGSETVNGYATTHVVASKGTRALTESDIWVTRDIAGLSYEAMRGLMRHGESDDSMFAALKDAGADGFIVKMVAKKKATGQVESTMELTRAEKRSLASSLFEIPAGYKKQEGMMGAASVMASPEQQEQMRKAMENLTPEQRKQIEEMMKKQGGK